MKSRNGLYFYGNRHNSARSRIILGTYPEIDKWYNRKKTKKITTMESWKVSNELWEQVAPLIPKHERNPERTYKRRAGGGLLCAPARNVFEAILYVLRTGIQWKKISTEWIWMFGKRSTSSFSILRKPAFEALWEKGRKTYDAFSGTKWEWQSVDGSMRKAPMALEGVGANPTDRGKNGSKTHMLTDGRSPAVTRRNRSQPSRCSRTWKCVESCCHNRNSKGKVTNLCADAGYTGTCIAGHPFLRIYSTCQVAREKKSCFSKVIRILMQGGGLWKLVIPGSIVFVSLVRFEKTIFVFGIVRICLCHHCLSQGANLFIPDLFRDKYLVKTSCWTARNFEGTTLRLCRNRLWHFIVVWEYSFSKSNLWIALKYKNRLKLIETMNAT